MCSFIPYIIVSLLLINRAAFVFDFGLKTIIEILVKFYNPSLYVHDMDKSIVKLTHLDISVLIYRHCFGIAPPPRFLNSNGAQQSKDLSNNVINIQQILLKSFVITPYILILLLNILLSKVIHIRFEMARIIFINL